MKLELYISNILCDIEDMSKFSVLLRRQFIHPRSLNTKDGQSSYSISLPATANNNEALDYINVEEVKGKFRVYKNARLIVDGVTILDGKFLLTEVSEQGYKGNLGVPKALTTKDVFGTTTMNNGGKWILEDFKGIRSMSYYNTISDSKCLFPFVLYGLLPRVPTENGDAIDKDLLNDTVLFGIRNFPPSVNCLQMLERFFDNAKYTLIGNAFDDERLKNLYVSYKNPNDFKQPWYVSPLRLKGSWTNYDSEKTKVENRIDQGVENYVAFEKKENDITVFATDLLRASNNKLEEPIEDDSEMLENQTITIHNSGLYKISLNAILKLQTDTEGKTHAGNGFNVKDAIESSAMKLYEKIYSTRHEVKIVRNGLGGKHDIEKVNVDNTFFRNNQDQDNSSKNNIYPQSGAINFVDVKQNPNLLCGLAWGQNKANMNTINPVATQTFSNPIVIKGNKSWDKDQKLQSFSVSDTDGKGYVKHTEDGTFKEIEEYEVKIQGSPTSTTDVIDDGFTGTGEVHQIVWLEQDETVTIVTNSDWGYDASGGWLRQSIEYSLDIIPFQSSKNWIWLDEKGNSTGIMKWGDDPTLGLKELDLIKYLPVSTRIDEWIDNFCKAFNLQLTHVGGDKFSLDIKQSEAITNTATYINLDDRATPMNSKNLPLDIPIAYEMGFTIDTKEEGYYESMDDDDTDQEKKVLNTGRTGKGIYETGGHGNDKLEQTSNFSYCWYKKLKDKNGKELEVPVITEREIWDKFTKYSEAIDKSYFDKAQRFWFKSGIRKLQIGSQKKIADIALVSNTYQGKSKLELNYGDVPNSITKEYFLLFNNSSEYTVVSCYLSPDEYNNLKYSKAIFNGDVYNIAEVDKYDPMGLKQCDLKLIKGIK